MSGIETALIESVPALVWKTVTTQCIEAFPESQKSVDLYAEFAVLFKITLQSACVMIVLCYIAQIVYYIHVFKNIFHGI